MLQIIGWLGCAMLAVKLLEMASSSAHRKPGGGMTDLVAYTQLAGWVAVLGFAFLFYHQGKAAEEAMDLPGLQQRAGAAEAVAECMEQADDVDAMLACQAVE